MIASAQRFKVGDRVKVKAHQPDGNPRTPEYIKGKHGVIAQAHGVIDNPIDHRGNYPPLYSVVFDVREVFSGSSRDTLSVDLHEEWLEPVDRL